MFTEKDLKVKTQSFMFLNDFYSQIKCSAFIFSEYQTLISLMDTMVYWMFVKLCEELYLYCEGRRELQDLKLFHRFLQELRTYL